MRIRITSPVRRWKGYQFELGGAYDLPEEDARRLIEAGIAVLESEPEAGAAETAAGVGSAPSSAGQPSQAAPAGEGGPGGARSTAVTSPPPRPPAQEEAQEAQEPADPRLLAWLTQRGFRSANGSSYSRIVQINGKFVRQIVDFKHNKWGSRYAYLLDEATGEFRPADDSYRDADALLEYKRFRDQIRESLETKLEVRRETRHVPVVGEGGQVALREQEVLVLAERRDEEQIMRELLGEVMRTYVYRFRVGDREVVNVSYAGIKEAARRRGNIHVMRVELDESKDGSAYIAKAEVFDLQNNFKVWGVASQPKRMTLRSGEQVDDPFALQKAASKAIRNGLRACIPEKLLAELIRTWLEREEKEAF